MPIFNGILNLISTKARGIRRENLPRPTKSEYLNDELMRRVIKGNVNAFLKYPLRGLTEDNIHVAKFYRREGKSNKVW